MSAKEVTRINTTKSKSHLSLVARIDIQSCLDCGMSFKAIARHIGKAQTTVSREVKRHITISKSSVLTSSNQPCNILLKPPFVCNPCKRKRCVCGAFDKHIYYAKKAQQAYEKLLKDSREGIPLNHELFYKTDRIITDGLKTD